MQDRQVDSMPVVRPCSQRHDDREDHRRRADDRSTDEHGLGGGLEGVARAVVLLEQILGRAEVHREPIVPLELLLDAGQLLNRGQLVHRLSVVGHRAVRIDRDSHGPHAEKAECHEAKRENRRREHDRAAVRAMRASQPERANPVRDRHEGHDRQAQPICAEVAGDEPGQNVQRSATLLRRRDHFPDVRRTWLR